MMPVRGYLITGGSGFFGQAFVRHLLANTDCGRICIYSRGEHRQAEMRQALRGDSDRLRFFVGDVRDRERLRLAMKGIDVVIAAAALKRIEVGAYCPDEMVKTNIIGSMNVVAAAADSGVSKVVFISSDKAWNGRSPYGQTKAIGESIFLTANNVYGGAGPKYSVCRYGNVWKSTGSVVPTWQSMIAAGAKAVPVTDPECTRFFMTRTEAVTLVQDTIDSMVGGELVIPKTLPAYRVGDLAAAMGVSFNASGLPAHEKLHEGMCDGVTSDIARRMSVEELKYALDNYD